MKEVDEDKIVRQYKNWSVKNIAKLNKIGEPRVKEILIRKGVKLKKSGQNWKERDLRF